MAGHSKWANIKHKKAREDAKRGKIWSKCSKAIMVAAKNGGPDPDANLTLRYAIDEAKSANMPKDNIKRAVEKGAGLSTGGADFEDVRYEGYGAAGVAVIVDCLTDNRNRTAGDVRMIFSKSGGNLGTANSVAFMFEMRGVVSIEDDKTTEDALMELALEAGAEDVQHEDGGYTVTCAPEDYLSVKGAIEGAGIEIADSELTMVPSNDAAVTGNDVVKVMRLVDALEDHDDVQKVYTNMDASEEDLAAATG
ncbi:MAG: YebC/PmpR family DNA-binding transcriptional regulator [Planctomycetota bacterium]